MIAAWRAATLGARTRLLEKNARLGLKIHISGGGKCNITHGGDMEALRRAFEPEEARFLRPADNQPLFRGGHRLPPESAVATSPAAPAR